ncbi:hypothetical protein PI124_g10710 [Phytophthora idaei]|nr:hypothetical protein PI125_g3439 [Phytophthora idaei]KAG3167765.1 hypothetical protein PI126_g3617 [Phytophthora idaei]KAG3244538.1 hypothetical protein PI124_g10710 [Phytophthora idaei]
MSYQNAPEEVKAALKAAEESDNSGGVHFGHTPTLLDAARLLEQAWSQIPDDLLENCFARANLVPPSKLLTPPAPPTGMTALEEQNQASMRYSDDIAGKMEEMLISRSLEARVWVMSTQYPPGNLRDRIRAFMYLDDENSFELQRQLQGEIHEALNDQASSASTPDMTALTDGSVRHSAETDLENPDLKSQIRGLLLGIADISSRLRLLPRTGAEALKLAPLELEGCIAAADQIRRCIQNFDNTLHKETNPDEQAVEKPAPSHK